LFGSGCDAALAKPIWADAHELITNPFFVYGPQDLGLGWRLLFLLAAPWHRLWACQRCRHRNRRHYRSIRLGDAGPRSHLPGAAHGAPLAWLRLRSRRSATASLRRVRHLHHRHLADHHQYRVGIRNIPDELPQCGAVLQLNPLEFFGKIMLPPQRLTSLPAFGSE